MNPSILPYKHPVRCSKAASSPTDNFACKPLFIIWRNISGLIYNCFIGLALMGVTPAAAQDSSWGSLESSDTFDAQSLLTASHSVRNATLDLYDDANPSMFTPSGITVYQDSKKFEEGLAMDVLHYLTGATLFETGADIDYLNSNGKKADFSVNMFNQRIGVSVTRVFGFPIGQPATAAATTTLLTRKLDDIQLANMNVLQSSGWLKQFLVVFSVDDESSAIITDVLASLDEETKGNVVVVIVTTGDNDVSLYTGSPSDRASQVITFPALPDIVYSPSPIVLTASSSSGLPVIYYATGPVSVSGTKLIPFGLGAVTVQATQTGNQDYDPAVPVTRSFTITAPTGPPLVAAWFADADGDGFGNGNTAYVSCLPLEGYVQNNEDCNDASFDIKPSATEIKDGIDNNCDGRVDEGFSTVVLNLTVTAACSDLPLLTRRWKITNPNAKALRMDWAIEGTIQKTWLDVPPGDSYLTTINVLQKNHKLIINWHDGKGDLQSAQAVTTIDKCSRGAIAASTPTTATPQLYPNPGTDRITVELPYDHDAIGTIQIMSASGVLKRTQSIQLSAGTNFASLDIATLERGIYILRINGESLRFTKE